MQTGVVNELPRSAVPRATAARVALGMGLLLVLVAAAAVLTTGSRTSPPTARGPVATSRSWLADHDFRMVAQVRGTSEVNITAVRHGDVLRGDVQTMDPGETRQTGWFRFRVRAGTIETTASGTRSPARWRPASPSEQSLLAGVTDPADWFAPFDVTSVHDAGRSGDAETYRDAHGNTLFVTHGRPVRLVTHEAGRTSACEVDPL